MKIKEHKTSVSVYKFFGRFRESSYTTFGIHV